MGVSARVEEDDEDDEDEDEERTNNNVSVNTLPSGSVSPHDSVRPQYAAAKSSWSRLIWPTGRYCLSLFPLSFPSVVLSSPSLPPFPCFFSPFSSLSFLSSSSPSTSCSTLDTLGILVVSTPLYVGMPSRSPGSAIQNMTCFPSRTCSRHSSIASVFQPQMTRWAWRRERSWADPKSMGMRRAPGGGGLGGVVFGGGGVIVGSVEVL